MWFFAELIECFKSRGRLSKWYSLTTVKLTVHRTRGEGGGNRKVYPGSQKTSTVTFCTCKDKVSPKRDVTLLARRVLPLVCYAAYASVTDER